MRNILTAVFLALAATCGSIASAGADETAAKQLAGRTLDVILGFNNTGSGARLWSVFGEVLRQRLPQTLIRVRYNDAGSGLGATNEVYAAPAGALTIGMVLTTELTFAQSEAAEGVAYDLTKVHWLFGLQREGQFMSARKGLSLNLDDLRKPDQRLIVPTDTIVGNSAIITALLNAVTGLHGRLVVGFNSTDGLRALVAGDGDIRRQMLQPEIVSLLDAGEIQSLYVIFGSGFPPSVDTSKTLRTVALPGAPVEVLDYIEANAFMGRAMFAAPSTAPEDVTALRTIMSEILTDEAVMAEIAEKFAKVDFIPVDQVQPAIDKLLLLDPRAKAAVALSHECGMAMSQGTLDQCDFSVLAN